MDLVSGESPFPGLQMPVFLLYPHMEEGGTLQHVLRKALIPFIRVPHSWPNYLPNAPPPPTITLGVRILRCKI